jgi:hypothetical protein
MGTIEKVKYELARIGLKINSQLGIDVQSSLNILIEYFENSPDFRLIEQKDGLSGNGYFDSEEDDRHKYRKYEALNDDLIVKVTISDFRKILVDVSKGGKFKGYFLKLNEQSQEAIPEYKIV